MKIAVNITNHNQNELVAKTISSLLSQKRIPDHIFITSDETPYNTDNPIITSIKHTNKGRCQNRNSVIQPFLKSDLDAIIFIDGDCFIENPNYIENYIELLSKYDLVFGTRKHTDITGLDKPPSDLLTANMDELWSKQPLNYQDLRIVTGDIQSWQESSDFYEKLDLMVTGMIGWSCNFGITKTALIRHLNFMLSTYGLYTLFDEKAFNKNWGYEDVAMGIDALYAGLDIWIDTTIEITHNSHNRVDNLFDHIKGRHLIMDRMRKLDYRIFYDKK